MLLWLRIKILKIYINYLCDKRMDQHYSGDKVLAYLTSIKIDEKLKELRELENLQKNHV